jgi:hypothetical protein
METAFLMMDFVLPTVIAPLELNAEVEDVLTVAL